MTRPVPPDGRLRILQLEDNADDAELTRRQMTDAGLDFAVVVVDTRESFTDQLAMFAPTVILVDYRVPGFSCENALEIVRQHDPDVPLIVLSGQLGDETAVELLRRGATDYVLKDRPARLPSVIRRAVAEAGQRVRQAQLEEQLTRTRRLAVVAKLAGGIAHEFNNKVGVMLNYAAFIRQEAEARSGDDWDQIHHDAQQIEQAGKRVIDVVRQLLAVGGLESTHRELMDLNEAINGIDGLLRSTTGDRIEFRADLAAGLWAVEADPARVRQVLLDLALNACDAMPDGGTLALETRNVRVSAEQAGDHAGLVPGAYARLRVRDTGTGMTKEALEHAFEPFYTTRSLADGRGLGLAAVYGIVTQAGGTADISSTLGVGTTVTAWLPAVSVGADAAPPARATILVVDDEPALRTVAARILRGDGYTVLEAADGEEALLLASAHEVNLLLTDTIMPRMSGAALTERLHQLNPALPVLFMSGYDAGILDKEGISDREQAFVAKPFTAESILTQVRALLSRPAVAARQDAEP